VNASSTAHDSREAELESAHYGTSGSAVLVMALVGLLLALAMLTIPSVRPGFIDGTSALVISSLMLLLGLGMIRHGAQRPVVIDARSAGQGAAVRIHADGGSAATRTSSNDGVTAHRPTNRPAPSSKPR
jgi:hypothetical protein